MFLLCLFETLSPSLGVSSRLTSPLLSSTVSVVIIVVTTTSYRRVPGDRCEGGFQPDRKETDLKRSCVSNSLSPKSLVSPPPAI